MKTTFLFLKLILVSSILSAQDYTFNRRSFLDFSQNSGFANPTVVGDKLYFTADDGYTGNELWVYDGDGAPRLAADIIAGKDGSNPMTLLEFDGQVYFSAKDSIFGNTLWRYNETDGATRISEDLLGNLSNPRFKVYRDKLYFKKRIAPNNFDFYLMEYDGLHPPVKAIEEPVPGGQMEVFQDRLCLLTEDSDGVNRLSFYDGENAPVQILDTASYLGWILPSLFRTFNDQLLYFAADRYGNETLWRYNGGDTLTSLANLYGPEIGVFTPLPYVEYYVEFKDELYFAAFDSLHGTELWSYDGSSAPRLVSDLAPGEWSSNPGGFVVYGDQLFFRTNDNSGVERFWAYDGVDPPQLAFGERSWWVSQGSEYSGVVYDEQLLFGAWDTQEHCGFEIQSYEGQGEPQLFFDLAKQSYTLSNPRRWAKHDGKLYYVDQREREVWQYDGSSMPRLIGTPGTIQSLASLNDRIWFLVLSGTERGLWSTTGEEPIGLSFLLDNYVSSTSQLMRLGDALYFLYEDDIFGLEFHRFNGTEPPFLAFDFTPGGSGSSIRAAQVINDHIYFLAPDNTTFDKLWRYDGAFVIEELDATNTQINYISPKIKAHLANYIYFEAYDRNNEKNALWVYDETTDKIQHLVDFEDLDMLASRGYTVIVDDAVYLRSQQGSGTEDKLWKFNGLNQPELLATIPGYLSNIFGSNLGGAPLFNFNGAIFFAAESVEAGIELWKYQSGQGAQLVRDFNFQAAHSSPRFVTTFKDKAILTVNDGHRLNAFWEMNTCGDNCCDASFFSYPDTSNNYSLLAINYSLAPGRAYTWDFGDGQMGTGPFPEHAYEEPGSYLLCLTVDDSGSNCTSQYCDSIRIKPQPFGTMGLLVGEPGPLVSIEEPTATRDQPWLVFPNPARETITVNGAFSEDPTLSLYHLNGQLLRRQRLGLTMNVSEVPSGIYLLGIQDSKQQHFEKVIIQR